MIAADPIRMSTYHAAGLMIAADELRTWAALQDIQGRAQDLLNLADRLEELYQRWEQAS